MDVVYPLPENDTDFGITYPIIEYDYDEGSAIFGGYIANNKELKDKYIFGDIPAGRIIIADINNPLNSSIQELDVMVINKITDLYILTKSNRVDLKFSLDSKGILYVFTKADGQFKGLKA
ncbi:hypothetical protein JQC67_16565 [Aurantibacter crassamenti]|uniref:hypothetical protein n=1 Tax=Aurantibacter crassamenti TaxID=1837375 RepID=UPI00193A949F|nr:hypothetical protein [Aurantibacter crassamenti]MBM1107771.1 hypothetical protein [Aurantibacter crassamenti]